MPLTEYFYKYLIPLALECGMPLKEFWEENPDLLWVYRDCFIKRLKDQNKIEQQNMNFQAWLYGLYVCHAIASTFGKKTYLSQPIDLEPKVQKSQKREVADKIKQKLKESKAMLEQRSV